MSRAELEKLDKRENSFRKELLDIDIERKQILNSLQEQTAINCVQAIYRFRNNFTNKVLKDFNAVNDCLAELAGLNEGYLNFLENTDIWDTPETKQEMRYLVSYLFGSAWRPADADLWRVLMQIADTITIPNNPFAKAGD